MVLEDKDTLHTRDDRDAKVVGCSFVNDSMPRTCFLMAWGIMVDAVPDTYTKRRILAKKKKKKKIVRRVHLFSLFSQNKGDGGRNNARESEKHKKVQRAKGGEERSTKRHKAKTFSLYENVLATTFLTFPHRIRVTTPVLFPCAVHTLFFFFTHLPTS
jgi:hypothetical protein